MAGFIISLVVLLIMTISQMRIIQIEVHVHSVFKRGHVIWQQICYCVRCHGTLHFVPIGQTDSTEAQ